MPNVLTEGSNVTCGHGGNVSTTGTPKLKVNGKPVLLKDGIAGKSTSGCKTPHAEDSSGTTADPCTSVTSVDAGEATKLKVRGSPVMLDSVLKGKTSGMVAKVKPQLLLSATVGQSKLKAT